MASVRSLFNGFFLLLLHLGCFFSSSNPNPNPNTDPTLDEHTPTPKRRKISPVSSSPSSFDSALNNTDTRKHRTLSLSLSLRFRSHVNRLFSFRNKTHKIKDPNSHPPAQPLSPPSPLHPSLPLSPDNDAIGGSMSSEPATKRGSFSARTEIFPCPACGEVLTKAHLLDLHQATKHALSDLRDRDGDSGRNIVGIIFHSGWIGGNPPVIHRILKIHHSPRTLTRFEEYREDVRARGEDERCIADGNERLRFYCSTVMCALGRERGGPPGACGAQFCSTCAIVRHGFSGKQAELGGIATHGTSWDAHVSLPEDLEREFAFLQVRRAMLVCRVIAGRVAQCGAPAEEKGAVWDSVVPLRRGGGARSSWAEDEELLVFSPRAVLPCFIIVYNS